MKKSAAVTLICLLCCAVIAFGVMRTAGAEPLLSGDGWEILEEYSYADEDFYYSVIVFKNTKDTVQNAEVTFTFCDAAGNMVGDPDRPEQYCASPGYEYCLIGLNDEPFDHVEYTFSLSDPDYVSFRESVAFETERIGNEVIITAKNIGEEPVPKCYYHIILFDSDDKVIYANEMSLDIEDPIQSGESLRREFSAKGDFDHYAVYFSPFSDGEDE